MYCIFIWFGSIFELSKYDCLVQNPKHSRFDVEPDQNCNYWSSIWERRSVDKTGAYIMGHISCMQHMPSHDYLLKMPECSKVMPSRFLWVNMQHVTCLNTVHFRLNISNSWLRLISQWRKLGCDTSISASHLIVWNCNKSIWCTRKDVLTQNIWEWKIAPEILSTVVSFRKSFVNFSWWLMLHKLCNRPPTFWESLWLRNYLKLCISKMSFRCTL